MMKLSGIFYLVILLCIATTGMVAGQDRMVQSDKITLIEYSEYEKTKERIEHNDPKAKSNYNRLIEKAESAIKHKGFSVVKKTGVPPSGDKHDYMTIGPYWWPNPSTSDGLPYIRRDGEINPETRNDFTDYVEWQNFVRSLTILRDAFYFSENDVYAKKALVLIKTWFLDQETKMNPNLDYSQSIPGKTDGRKFGIIEFANIVEVVKCLELLGERNQLDPATQLSIKAWLSEYARWLQYSENGKGEAHTKNNHATYYDLQLLSILTYLGKTEEVKKYLSTITISRIYDQIEPDGSQPLELARTKSFSYSVMNLHGFLSLARLGKKVGVDLWDAQTSDGRSIKKGFEYMLSYFTEEKAWEYEQIADAEGSRQKLIEDIKYASQLFEEDDFNSALQLIEKGEANITFRK
ncbi:hypothetical protein DN752_01215 [Echinicola strongylocentroti]|uniref:Alginate lyase domain-containing protein n=1 Tax=Echinicola strongylocentroti TaxID=1795355 RepID=A0A2Z4IEF0_9BACT|nr:alginate lyase family protein [Echinicola strongylocentroti]AWW28858.1 hypothetical protein DN752_01215 [Echinicola strongylocentroti]